MKKVLWASIGVLAGFGLGLAVTRLDRDDRIVPAPSTRLLGELTPPDGIKPVRIPLAAGDVRRLEAEQAAVERDLVVFRAEFQRLETEFKARVSALLTPVQREKFENGSEAESSSLPLPRPLPVNEAGDRLTTRPGAPVGFPLRSASPALPDDVLRSLVELTFVSWSLENLEHALQLTGEQKAALKPLLHERRERFLTLVDRLPPPTLRLLTVARSISATAAPAPSPGDTVAPVR